MSDKKRTFKYFAITQADREEKYLDSMHKKGWKLDKVNFINLYHFSKCTPEEYTYKLDYNCEGLKNKDEYYQMFNDCGWEHVDDYVGYSYFRKKGNAEKEDIFCDEESKLDYLRRVFRGRVIPLIIIYFCCILPQLYMHAFSINSFSATSDRIFTNIFAVLSVVYLTLFIKFVIEFHKYEKKLSRGSYKVKYLALYSLLAAGLISTIAIFYVSHQSNYKVTDNNGTYTVEAERLNKTINKSFDFKKGDIVNFKVKVVKNFVHLNLKPEGKKSVFFGDFKNSDNYTYEIQEDGKYNIEISGNNTQADVSVYVTEK